MHCFPREVGHLVRRVSHIKYYLLSLNNPGSRKRKWPRICRALWQKESLSNLEKTHFSSFMCKCSCGCGGHLKKKQASCTSKEIRLPGRAEPMLWMKLCGDDREVESVQARSSGFEAPSRPVSEATGTL